MPSENLDSNRFLLIKLSEGNSKAFRRLFDLYWEPLYIKAKTIIGNEDVAKDIVQDIWIKLWQKRESLEIDNFESYIYRAVKNNCFKYFRDNKFSKVHLEIIEGLGLISEPEVKQQHDLEDTIVLLRESMGLLPTRCKKIFELSRIEEYSNEEIASELGISKRSVENQISIAVKSIRHTLSANLSLLLFFILS